MTPRQLRVLDYLREYISRAGFSPTQRQIATDLGVSPAQVNRVIAYLVSAGHLRRDRDRTRAIELADTTDLRGASVDAIRAELARRGLSLDALASAAPKALGRGVASCAADSCQLRVEVGHLFCRDHWRALPHALRDAILRAYSDRDRARYQELVTKARDLIDAPRYERVGGR